MLVRLLGAERLKRLPRGGNAAALAAAVVAAALGPAAAIALGDSGGTGLIGGTTTSSGGAINGDTTGGATTGVGMTTTATTGGTTTGGSVVTVTTPCSGSIGSTSTKVGATTVTTVPTTTVVTTTQTVISSQTVTTTETVPTTTTVTDTTTTPPTVTTITGTTTTPVTTTVPVTTTIPVTTTEPATLTQTTPGTTTVRVTPPCTTTAPPPSTIKVPKRNPFRGRAMWIWQLQRSDGGNVAAIIAQAKKYAVAAVYIKSSDGTTYWPQFSRQLVTELHQAGIRVCAWQYVYGINPVVEANLGARAARTGANCLVIDAESEYQSKYPQAQSYISRLRKLIGNRFPVGLAGFPYVGYHLSFPYSVFLGPGGAQYNLPQMYWADIGTTVRNVFAVTYEYNEIYRRPIFPLGQLWNSGKGMSVGGIEQFNLLAQEYGATGVSWWDWQSASRAYWNAIDTTATLPVSYGGINRTPASIYRGNKGDLVIWAQEHLYRAGYRIAIDGQFGQQTQAAVRAFQRRRHLPASGVINGITWDRLLKVKPVSVHWTHRRKKVVAVVARRARVAGRGGARTTLVEPVPAWMKHTHAHNELHGDVGAGGGPERP